LDLHTISKYAPRLDPRSDLFAAGVLLFEMLAGKPAFSGSTLLEIARRTAGQLASLGVAAGPVAVEALLEWPDGLGDACAT